MDKGVHLRGGDVRVETEVCGAIEHAVRAEAGGGPLLQVMRDASIGLRRYPGLRRVKLRVEQTR